MLLTQIEAIQVLQEAYKLTDQRLGQAISSVAFMENSLPVELKQKLANLDAQYNMGGNWLLYEENDGSIVINEFYKFFVEGE